MAPSSCLPCPRRPAASLHWSTARRQRAVRHLLQCRQGQQRHIICQAGSKPGPEYAALEAAVGAINKVLSFNSKLRGTANSGAGDSGSRSSGAGGGGVKGRSGSETGSSDNASAGGTPPGAASKPADAGKLVTFRARASGGRDVTVRCRRGWARVVVGLFIGSRGRRLVC